jgi:hypothetical protein
MNLLYVMFLFSIYTDVETRKKALTLFITEAR